MSPAHRPARKSSSAATKKGPPTHTPSPVRTRPATSAEPTPYLGGALNRLRQLDWARLLLGVALVAVFILTIPIAQKLGLRAVCYADWAGFTEAALAELPGGALRWVAALASVLWRVPAIGGCVYLLLSAGVLALGVRWARLPFYIAVLPVALGLWQIAYCGFSAWIFVDATFPALYLLAWGTMVAMVGCGKRWGVASAGLMVALYPICGSPALVGGLLVAALPQVRHWARGVLVAVAVALPVVWQRCAPADPAWSFLLPENLPILLEEGSLLWDTVVFVAMGVLAGYPLIARAGAWCFGRLRVPACWLRRAAVVAPVAAFLGACVWGMDPVHPLVDLLACEQALARGDMARILAVPHDRVVGHRMLGAYTIHALWRTGRLEEALFDFPWRVSHEATTIDTMELDGYNLLYHAGIVQLARRWCYESVVNKGWSGPKYELLAKIALICDEPALARRYARQLRRLPLWGAVADELLAVADGTPPPEGSELRRVADLHHRLCADTGSPVFEGDKRLEAGLYNRYAVLKNGSREMVALYLCASLLRKDAKPFLENFEVICSVWPQRPLPRVFQQALLAAAATVPQAEQPRLTADLFSPGMVQAFADFRRLAGKTDPNDPDFGARFGRTYWFYATFVP